MKNNHKSALPPQSHKSSETKFVPMPSMSMLPERDADKEPVLEVVKLGIAGISIKTPPFLVF